MFTRTTTLAALTWALVLAAQPAAADFKLERRLALRPGGQFVLDSDVGAVTITGDTMSDALVTVTSKHDDLDERFDFRFDEGARRVTVTIKRRGGWVGGFFRGDWSRDGEVRIAIRVPQRTDVEARTSGGSVGASGVTGQARLRTSGGSLDVQEIEGDIEADTSGGRIRVERVRGDVDADTSGGSIDITYVRGNVRAETSGGGVQIDRVTGEVVARTSGGSVRVREAGGRVEAHSSGGPVTVGFARGNDHGGVLSASGGSIRAELDPAVALSIDATASGGRVTTDLAVTTPVTVSNHRHSWPQRFPMPQKSESLRADLNGSGPVLRLRSRGGDIRIVRASRSAEGSSGNR